MSHLAETNGRSEAGEGDQAHGRGAELLAPRRGTNVLLPRFRAICRSYTPL